MHSFTSLGVWSLRLHSLCGAAINASPVEPTVSRNRKRSVPFTVVEIKRVASQNVCRITSSVWFSGLQARGEAWFDRGSTCLFLCPPRISQKSSPTPKFRGICIVHISLVYCPSSTSSLDSSDLCLSKTRLYI